MQILPAVLAATLLALLPSSIASGQAKRVYARTSRPPRSVALDLATGTITSAPAPRAGSASTVIDFSNNDLGGFVGLDTGDGFCEWFDAGVKGFAGNQSDLMSEIVFPYCTAMRDTSAGGPGGSVRLGFYEGYTVFGGAPTTAAAIFTLTGLPGNSASSSFFGGFDCFFVRVIFGSLVSFADGPIGYSWRFLDVGTRGVLAGTWPFLACVSSCSGIGAVPDKQGMIDAIDKYCPPGNLQTTFTFGSTSGGFTSIAMDIREATDLAATQTSYNAAATPNPDTLVASAPVLGATWTATLTRGRPSLPGLLFVQVRAKRLPLADGLQAPAPFPVGAGGRLLASGPLLRALSDVHSGLRGSVVSSIPASFDLLGAHFAVQAIVVGGGTQLSSAVEGTVGTF